MLVVFDGEKSRAYYLILFDRKSRPINNFAYTNLKKKKNYQIMRKSFQNNNDLEDSTSWRDHTALAKRTKDDRIENLVKSDSFRRSTIIWWKWSKGFDNRIKLVEQDQYYESWYDRSYRNMFRDFFKKLLSSVDDIFIRDRSSDYFIRFWSIMRSSC